tara:strand:+ start:2868 stop:3548 length:681 start_codon:yes stop_codon:yes gene_type:complete
MRLEDVGRYTTIHFIKGEIPMNMQSVKRVSGWMFVLGCLGIVFGIEGCGKQAAEHPVETASHVREEDDVIQIPATSAEGQSTLVTPSLMKESQIHTPAIASAATTLTYLDTDTVVVKEGFENIYFDFDQWAISKLMQAQLAVSAQWLNTHPETMVSIEGYCDARGGRKYNVVLAEKRANAVKEVWVDLGVAEERLSTISYGREGLTCFTDDVQCHKANRRAQFVVK